ncbi:radical SAM protein [Acidaminobacter hydrogenoformans]|uniref:Wyosine [tRNA(Phe)-imidazoG37] synthetase, radical SAM superfamily n=1 Tax=Acidaminobacter hydrogenoformans DSM 2784 TaxID=1120920 RepID=A0A1G5S313_9FIRM|nr:radical SAM protein [Acidaminobacter hydrogenoformans]SCZ80141.1 Wyosine [tRNA(Phe)-imidazoG37] synthetase, radical SAM superfamily [Acidaminobacter hydrogenoformans DSM 2784]
MNTPNYVYGPVPSRRLGLSLGVSPIPKKTCNYSCVYCQLGRTDHMTNTRQRFFPVADLLAEAQAVIESGTVFDVITIVGEGEPTLYLELGVLIKGLKRLTDKPVAVITNGALLYEKDVQAALMEADFVLPTLDASDEGMFKRINRPHGALDFSRVLEGLREFSRRYEGQLWIEIMLVKGMNDNEAELLALKALLDTMRYDRLYLNTVVRPPAESGVEAVDGAVMRRAVELLSGLPIDLLESEGFYSGIEDHGAAVLSIIKRHPMNQFEIEAFLVKRGAEAAEVAHIMEGLRRNPAVDVVDYKGYETFRMK